MQWVIKTGQRFLSSKNEKKYSKPCIEASASRLPADTTVHRTGLGPCGTPGHVMCFKVSVGLLRHLSNFKYLYTVHDRVAGSRALHYT